LLLYSTNDLRGLYGETCPKKGGKIRQITGSNYFVGSFCFGTLTHEQTLRSLRLFAEEVMPACRSAG